MKMVYLQIELKAVYSGCENSNLSPTLCETLVEIMAFSLDYASSL